MNKELIAKCNVYDFKKLFERKGYAFFTKGVYNLNIIGVRNKGNKVTNMFDDVLVIIYKTPSGRVERRTFSITTQPGVRTMMNPINRKGTAILAPGQYRGCWKLGLHKGQYAALVQCKPVKIFRDNNKDLLYDCAPETTEKGVFGINIHKAGPNSYQVDNWSAGCQVFQRHYDFNSFIRYCKNQIANGFGDTFTYTLLDEEDMV